LLVPKKTRGPLAY